MKNKITINKNVQTDDSDYDEYQAIINNNYKLKESMGDYADSKIRNNIKLKSKYFEMKNKIIEIKGEQQNLNIHNEEIAKDKKKLEPKWHYSHVKTNIKVSNENKYNLTGYSYILNINNNNINMIGEIKISIINL